MISGFLLLPLWYQYTVIIGFGLIIGSFLNVVLYRFHTGKSLSGSSHCLSCGTPLRWYELFPLLSYLFLLGRCRSCGSWIPVRYFLVEMATAALFLFVFLQYGLTLLALVVGLLCIVLLMVTVYDLYHMVIPNELVVATAAVSMTYFVLTEYTHFSFETLLWHMVAAFGAFGFYGGLWLVSHGRWIGLGDAKLALPLGFLLGPMGAFSFVILSFWVGAAVSLCMLALPQVRTFCTNAYIALSSLWTTCPQGSVVKYRRYFTMKSEVPFAPFMVIAFLLVLLCNVEVLALMATLL